MTLIQARELVKDALRKQGIKLSHVSAKEITKAARTLLKQENAKLPHLRISALSSNEHGT